MSKACAVCAEILARYNEAARTYRSVDALRILTEYDTHWVAEHRRGKAIL